VDATGSDGVNLISTRRHNNEADPALAFFLETAVKLSHPSPPSRQWEAGQLSRKSLVRQAKLGAFSRVRVPAREGLTTHLYRVLQ
jgi:hypothetical protein